MGESFSPNSMESHYFFEKKGGPLIMMNIIVGAVLVIGLAIAIKEIMSKNKK